MLNDDNDDDYNVGFWSEVQRNTPNLLVRTVV